jgi:hypothetical protein
MATATSRRAAVLAKWTAPAAGGIVAFAIGFALGDAFKVGMTTPGPWSLAPVLLLVVAIVAGVLGLVAILAAIARHFGTARVLGVPAITLVVGTYVGQAMSAGYLGR